jgi:hypothetical protein
MIRKSGQRFSLGTRRSVYPEITLEQTQRATGIQLDPIALWTNATEADREMKSVNATVVRGYRLSSGDAPNDQRFPGGTLRMQIPCFAAAGFDIEHHFGGDFVIGTANLSVAPAIVRLKRPEIFLEGIKWSPVFPAETFYLSPAQIVHDGTSYRALLYIPDPATKIDHFPVPSMIEAIAQPIAGIGYDDRTTLIYNPEAISIEQA